MATIHDVITRALRRTGDCDKNELPEGPQLDDALASFQALLEHFVFSGLLCTLTDVLVDTDCTAGEFQRIVATTPVTVILPATITECGVSRPPVDGAINVICVGSPTAIWRYDGRTTTWVALSDLALEDTAPLSDIGMDGLAACLALWMAGPADQMSPTTAQDAAAFRMALAGRFGAIRADLRVNYF